MKARSLTDTEKALTVSRREKKLLTLLQGTQSFKSNFASIKTRGTNALLQLSECVLCKKKKGLVFSLN